ncbi:MAG: hypothetical protein JKY65_01145 [Planctomycetes bacterium]|nr:hypothetical protein [Planctomycetota bacterium]
MGGPPAGGPPPGSPPPGWQPPGDPSKWGPPAPPPQGPHQAPILAGAPNYLFGSLTAGLVVGLMTGLFSCCCAMVIGWIGGGGAAWAARQRAAVFGVREGAYAGFLAAIVATLVFSAVYIPVTLFTSNRVRTQGLNQAERDLIQQFPMISEEQMTDQMMMSGSAPMILLAVGLHAGLFFMTCVIGGAAVGGFRPKAPQGWGPPPPGYQHPHGPPPGVPEPYAAPGYNEDAEEPPPNDEPRHSTAWKELSPEELALPITLDDDDPPAKSDADPADPEGNAEGSEGSTEPPADASDEPPEA